MILEVQISHEARRKLPGVNIYGRLLAVGGMGACGDFADQWISLQQKWNGKPTTELEIAPRLVAFRNFYSDIGFDAKQTPPSVENLIKRFLLRSSSKRFPNINPIVNAVNVAAVEHEVPLGVFDTEAVSGQIRLDFSQGGEPFHPLGVTSPIRLESGKLVLRDDDKVLSIFCYRDGDAQKITPQTRNIALLGCQVDGIETAAVMQAMQRAIELIESVVTVSA